MVKSDEYDIREAFKAIEDELLDSMMRNMKRHRAEEREEGFEWSQWQVAQLKGLELYKRKNAERFQKKYDSINAKMRKAILSAKAEGGMAAEVKILDAIMKGAELNRVSDKLAGEFFRTNERKMDALLNAVTGDMERAERAILRMHDDKVRRAIFNAQVYANSGAGTYEKAVDMAVKDYTLAGLNCILYRDGRRVNVKDYADMALRTASKRAYLMGEGEKRQEWGVHTVIMNKRGNACHLCLPWVGKILIDDVWSGGTAKEAVEGNYPLMSTAMAAGLYHPNCRDSHTTYFPGISTPPDHKWTKQELRDIEQNTKQETKRQYAKKQKEKYERLERNALDSEDKKRYAARRQEWEVRSGSVIESEKKKTDIAQPKAEAGKSKNISQEMKERRYTAKELDGMSIDKLKGVAEKTATEYYQSGISGISFGDKDPGEAAKMLVAKGSKTSLKKDILTMQKKMKDKGYNLQGESGSDIIKSNIISGARNPYGKAAEEHAEKYYGLVRSMKTDVKKIAQVTGFSEKEIQSIKNYIFIDEHNLGGLEPERFSPDYMMAESWRRLQEGAPEPHDITMLHHEKMERELISNGITQQEAHIATSKIYNYDKEATEYYDKIKKYRKE